MKFVLAALVIAILQGCSSSPLDQEDEWLVVARAAQPQLERGQSDVTYIVPDTINPSARSALSKLRRVLSPSEVPTEPGFKLPKGYIVINRFEVSGGSAVVAAQGDPVVAGNRLSCGYYVNVPLKLVAGRWVAEQVPIAVC